MEKTKKKRLYFSGFRVCCVPKLLFFSVEATWNFVLLGWAYRTYWELQVQQRISQQTCVTSFSAWASEAKKFKLILKSTHFSFRKTTQKLQKKRLQRIKAAMKFVKYFANPREWWKSPNSSTKEFLETFARDLMRFQLESLKCLRIMKHSTFSRFSRHHNRKRMKSAPLRCPWK